MTPRAAFCFHDPNPTGASLWLRELLLTGPFDPAASLAILPSPSQIAGELKAQGFRTVTLRVRMGDLSTASAPQRLAIAANRIEAVASYRRLFRRWRPQVVYVNSSYQIAPMIAAWREGLPLLVHVHEGWRSGRTHALKRFVVRHAAHTAVFASQHGMKLFGPPRPRRVWEVSPNGVSPALAQLRARHQELRRQFAIGENEQILLFLGSLTARKGLHDLLQCWPRIHREFPHARLVVGGVIDQFENNSLIRAFPQNPPEGARYLGFVDNATEWLAAADLLLLPSYAEAMPITISEAMMTGTPVVARAVADVPWQIGEGRGFLFRGDGPEPLERELRQALSNPDDATRRAALAQQFAREHLTREKQQDQILRLVETTLRITHPR